MLRPLVHRPSAGAIGATLLLACCGPRVTAFDVMPRSLCPGQQARVTWQVRGTPTLLVRVSDPRLGLTDPDPDLSLVPDTLEFTIVAVKGAKEAVRRLDVQQFADSAETEVVFPTVAAGDSIVAAGVKSPVRWAEQFVVRSVRSSSGRDLVVRHAGRSVRLAADGTPSSALDGTPVEGEWDLRALRGASPLDRLRVGLVIACRRTAP